ncbi:aspartyl-phosphate phosphatase Spo0E family protein, partial [Metabacillus niabensis]
MKSIDAKIEEYRKKMFVIAKENGIESHLTLIASQNLDELLNIKMNESHQN